MPLTPAKCTECGGLIDVDLSKKAGICKYCGMPFVIEDAVNNYNYYIYNESASMEALLERERIYLEAKEYEKLNDLYSEMIKYYPQRHEGWWGFIYLAYEIDKDYENSEKWNVYWKKVEESAPNDKISILKNKFKRYQVKQLNYDIPKLEAKIENLNFQVQQIPKEIKKLKHNIESCSFKIKSDKFFCYGIGSLFLLIVAALIYYAGYFYSDVVDFVEDVGFVASILIAIIGIALIWCVFFNNSFFECLREADSCKKNIKTYEEEISKKTAELEEIQNNIKELEDKNSENKQMLIKYSS